MHYCDWNSHHNILATGSKDATCRIWQLDELAAQPPQAGQPIEFESVVLPHHTSHITGRVQDVTSLAWSPDGNVLVTGCYDGVVTGWSKDGQQLWQTHTHSGPVFALKWTPNGQMIVCGSWDGKAIVMSAANGKVMCIFVLEVLKLVVCQLWTRTVADWTSGGSCSVCVHTSLMRSQCLTHAGEIMTFLPLLEGTRASMCGV